MLFSPRVPRLEPNTFSTALAAERRAGRRLIDLTASNPTSAGFTYPPDLLAPLCRSEGLRYSPEPFGAAAARAAVSAEYARQGLQVAAERIILTASTSEAYSLLFKLLCAPGGERVLVPVPSYPLFEHLTRLDGVDTTPYPLHYDGRWWVDFDSVGRVWDARTRAVLVVSPNNPTGSLVSGEEYAAMASRCASRDAALIVDEVFADYPIEAGEATMAAALPGDCLSFRLGGLSKSVALPQLKLGWMVVGGPDALVAGALERLELICDTYLSVSTPVQVACPDLLREGAQVRAQVSARIRGNHALLRARCAEYPSVDLLHIDGGWSAVLRVAATRGEEDLVMSLLQEDGVVVHPGFFFDFPHEAFLVLSLLPEPAAFGEGIHRLLERVDA